MSPDADLDLLVERARAGGAYSAASVIVAVDAAPRYVRVTGRTRTADGELPAAPLTAQTRFDLASLTKPIVAAALLRRLELDGVNVDAPAAALPELGAFAPTYADLLAHRAGFPAEWLDRSPDPGARRFLAASRPRAEIAGTHVYSCVGYIWAGIALARLHSTDLATAVDDLVLRPLGMAHTGYRPRDASGTVATEIQPGRGLVHGDVHDETAWAFGGVSGNAGLFGTAADLMRFLEAVRTGHSPLSPGVIGALVTPVIDGPGYRQTLGLRSRDRWMGALGHGVGHTGFTGGAMLTEPQGSLSVVFLTNRVHPHREGADLTDLRARVFTTASSFRS